MQSLYRSFMKSFIMIIFTVTLLLLIFVLGPMSAFYSKTRVSTQTSPVKKTPKSNLTNSTRFRHNFTKSFHEILHLTLKDAITQPSVVNSSKFHGTHLITSPKDSLQNYGIAQTVDYNLFKEDIECSKAYAKSLTRVGLLTRKECHNILDGLEMIGMEWENGTFDLKPDDKDVHAANERRLAELIGSAANKLNAGWDRNDQLATSLRLWQKNAISVHKNDLIELLGVITERAEKELGVLMAGYTVMQQARPIRWSHWLLSFGWKIKRDIERLMDLLSRVDLLPLGSGALAGNPFGVDRMFLAKELGFADIIENSIDAVNDQDIIFEYVAWASIMAAHFHNLANDLILYSTKDFGFVELSHPLHNVQNNASSFSNENARSLEEIRGKTNHIFGEYTDMLSVLKEFSNLHNNDFLSNAKGMFDIYKTIVNALPITRAILSSLKINPDKMEASLSEDMLLPDLEYYMVRKGLPADKAHSLVGMCVRLSQKKGVTFSKLSLAELRSVSPVFDLDVKSVWNYNNSVEQYTLPGGTSHASVQLQIDQLKKWMSFQR
ncbi:argininosuccinate lyase [Octopus bimaculoides]|uniref:Fumarate lyase N-terminal domain-containing protein n=1 Tax=Octopus bimaculoides TaxID=37653 RepID=A0A0L8H918_OCTBM|nr:argininosuccinate lyase [Octopus bimaculoides]XP_014774461.1 argininosuccinate lyase [Octopus bimaculoides]|eukprot:XP_014774460.1 PREDICTED: argininosuccinate lyase-like [Octopus bimaculoides]